MRHKLAIVLGVVVVLSLATNVWSQNPVTTDSPFQIGYAANLDVADSFVNLSNSGANGAPLLGPGFGGAVGNICANVYVFSPDEEMIACCSCLVTPNNLKSYSVQKDLISNPLQDDEAPTSVAIKIVSTLAGTGGTGTSCTNSAATVTTATLAAGLLAWQVNPHVITGTIAAPNTSTYCKQYCTPAPISPAYVSNCNTYCKPKITTTTVLSATQTPFRPATLSAGELASLGGRCAYILGNGSGDGICASCRLGAQ